DLGQLDVHVLEDARGDAFALADEAEQQVLGADEVVVEPLRLVLSKRTDLGSAVRELVEAIHRVERLFPCERLNGDAPAMLARCPTIESRPIGGYEYRSRDDSITKPGSIPPPVWFRVKESKRITQRGGGVGCVGGGVWRWCVAL